MAADGKEDIVGRKWIELSWNFRPNHVVIKRRVIMWKDWTNVVLGLWLAASPWLIGGVAHSANVGMVYNCVFTGIGIALFSGWAVASSKEVWQEWAVIFLSIWLLIAPGTLAYDILIVTWNNVIVGLAVAILAIPSISRRNLMAHR